MCVYDFSSWLSWCSSQLAALEEWSDDRIYCSELVWKVFKQGAGVELGHLQTIADFDLSHPAVQKKLKERYGKRIPLGEIVISPAAIFDDAKLRTVFEN